MEFIKKFFWLIFTAVFSLFTLLLTTTFKNIYESTEVFNPFNYHVSETKAVYNSIISHYKQIVPELNQIQKKLNTPDSLDRALFEEWLEKSIRNESRIQVLTSDLDYLISKYGNLQNPIFTSTRRDLELHREFLFQEKEFWVSVIKHSIAFLSEKNSFDLIPAKYELFRKRVQIFTVVKKMEKEPDRYLTFWNTTLIEFLKISLLVTLTVGSGYFIVFILGPIGMGIWEESKINP